MALRCALLLAACAARGVGGLPSYAVSTAPLAALQQAAAALNGRSLLCVHVLRDAADSGGDGHARVNAATPDGVALLTNLAAAPAGTAVPASASSLTGASMTTLAALASAWEFSVSFSAVVAPAAASPSDALGAALWAFSALGANCTLQPLPATPAAAAFAALPLPHAAAEYIVVSAPARRASGPSIFSQPLAWTAPFRWPLWACVGGSVVLASAAQAAFEAAPGSARPRAAAAALLGWRFAPPATPAGRLHATAFAFTSALLFAQYVARAAAMAGAADGGALASGGAALCVADVASHAAFAAAALPSLPLTRRASASPAALLAALRSGDCGAALTTASDAAFAAGGPGDAAGAHCGLPAPARLQPVQPLALPLAPATAPAVVAALGALLAQAAAPGGAFAAAAEAAFPAAAPHCAGGARWAASSAAAPPPLSLRDLSGIFMLQVAAGIAAAMLHWGGAAGRALARRRTGKGAAADGREDEELLELEVAAAENGFAHDWHESDDSDAAARKETPRRRAAAALGSKPHFDAEAAQRRSPALRDAVQQMQAELGEGDGLGWGPPAPRRAGGRGTPRSELLAVEADAARLTRAPASDAGPVRSRSRTPPRAGAASADHFMLVPPPRSPPRSPRSAGGGVRGRPALPRDGGEDFLDTRL